MREIKFRAWDKEDKRMIYMQDYKPQSFFEDLFALENGKKNLFPEYTMQFTGLKDKNGKEIYEGDIVIHYDMRNGIALNYEQPKRKSVIIWDNKEATFALDGYNCYGFEREYEVIGNIYENPELLKGAL